eukprot:949257-Prorocentrum_minimum.AAC.1
MRSEGHGMLRARMNKHECRAAAPPQSDPPQSAGGRVSRRAFEISATASSARRLVRGRGTRLGTGYDGVGGEGGAGGRGGRGRGAHRELQLPGHEAEGVLIELDLEAVQRLRAAIDK